MSLKERGDDVDGGGDRSNWPRGHSEKNKARAGVHEGIIGKGGPENYKHHILYIIPPGFPPLLHGDFSVAFAAK